MIRAAWLVVLAGCSGWLGLAPTTRDTDRDGVPNEADNCPDVANADQDPRACDPCPPALRAGRDIDQDGLDDGIGNLCDCVGDPAGIDANDDGVDDGCAGCVGGKSSVAIDVDGDGVQDGCDTCIFQSGVDVDDDALDDQCDVCPAGPPGDEDEDGVEDWCDNCPVVANADQAIDESDEDSLGDACDPVPTLDHARRLFDPFTDRQHLSERWLALPDGFSVDTGALAVVGDANTITWESKESIPAKILTITAGVALDPGGSLLLGVVVTRRDMADPTPPISAICGLAINAEGKAVVSVRELKDQVQIASAEGSITDGAVVDHISMKVAPSITTGMATLVCEAFTNRVVVGSVQYEVTTDERSANVGIAAIGAGAGVVRWIEVLETASFVR